MFNGDQLAIHLATNRLIVCDYATFSFGTHLHWFFVRLHLVQERRRIQAWIRLLYVRWCVILCCSLRAWCFKLHLYTVLSAYLHLGTQIYRPSRLTIFLFVRLWVLIISILWLVRNHWIIVLWNYCWFTAFTLKHWKGALTLTASLLVFATWWHYEWVFVLAWSLLATHMDWNGVGVQIFRIILPLLAASLANERWLQITCLSLLVGTVLLVRATLLMGAVLLVWAVLLSLFVALLISKRWFQITRLSLLVWAILLPLCVSVRYLKCIIFIFINTTVYIFATLIPSWIWVLNINARLRWLLRCLINLIRVLLNHIGGVNQAHLVSLLLV